MFGKSNFGLQAACAGLVFGLLMAGISPSFGQAADTAPGADIAALQAQIAVLTKRIDDLEKAEKEPKKAPFTVVNAAGTAIFTVAAEGSGAAMYVYGPAGTISMNAADRLSLLIDSGGASSATLIADDAGPSLVLRNGDSSVVAGADGGTMSLVVQQGANKVALKSSEQASLSIDSGDGTAYISADGDGPTLLLHKGESNLIAGPDGGAMSLEVQQGASKVVLKSGEQASLSVDSGDGTAYISTDADGPSLLLHKGEANLIAGPDGGKMSLVVQQGENSATLSAGADAVVSVQEASRSAKLGAADSTFGVSTEVDGSRTTALGDIGDGKYSLRIYQQGATLPVVQAGLLSSGTAGFVVGDGTDQFARIEGMDGGGVVRTYKGGEEVVTLGKLGDQSGLRVLTDDQTVVAALGGEGPEFILSAGGQETFRAYTSENQGALALSGTTGQFATMGAIGESGMLELSKGGQPTITLGPTEAKPLPGVRAYEAGKMVFAAGGNTLGSGIAVVYGGDSIGADMTGAPGGGGAITAYAQGKPVASVNSIDKPGEGLVIVRGASGAGVAWLGYSASNGGEVVAADPGGQSVFVGRYRSGAGGENCIASDEGTKCLGIGLTGMEGFH
jgi:hypothetical protein